MFIILQYRHTKVLTHSLLEHWPPQAMLLINLKIWISHLDAPTHAKPAQEDLINAHLANNLSQILNHFTLMNFLARLIAQLVPFQIINFNARSVPTPASHAYQVLYFAQSANPVLLFHLLLRMKESAMTSVLMDLSHLYHLWVVKTASSHVNIAKPKISA